MCSQPHEVAEDVWRAGVSYDLIVKAAGVLFAVMANTSPPPSVIPTADGSIQFVWHKGGWDIEIEVADDFVEGWAQQRATGRELVGEFDQVGAELTGLVASLG